MRLNHPETIPHPSGPWKIFLPQNLSLVPKRLGTIGLYAYIVVGRVSVPCGLLGRVTNHHELNCVFSKICMLKTRQYLRM